MRLTRSLRTAVVPVLLSVLAPTLSVVAAAPPAAATSSVSATAAAHPATAPVQDRAAPASGDDPTTLDVEDFEHDMGTTPVMLDRYVGVDGETYTADPAWINAAQCNGIITSASSSDVAACPANSNLRALGDVLGQITGESRTTNHVVSAWTRDRDLPANAVQIESEDSFSLGKTGRYVSFGVSAAAGSCVGYAHPLLDFILLDGAVERPVSSRPIDPCSDPRSTSYSAGGATFRGGEYVSNGGVLFSGTELRWRLRNAQSSSTGNDGAIDRVTIVDSTPTLRQEFTGDPIIGDTARMTLRVVNTSEHGAKPGWSFRQALPAGLTIAEQPDIATTCANPTTTIADDRGGISVTGDLAIDAADCEVSFDVVADAPGSYTADGAATSEAVGLDLGSGATVDFAPERNELAVTERAALAGGNDDSVADLDEDVTFATTIRNDGNVLVRDLTVDSDGGPVTCAAADLDPGASTECVSGPREVTQDDLDSGAVSDTVRVAATSRGGQPVEATASASVPTTPAAGAATLAVRAVSGDQPGVGDGVRLRVTVRNAGNVSIQDLDVTFPDGSPFHATCPAGAVAPRAAVDCAIDGSYAVTQGDVDAGSVAFTVRMTGRVASGGQVSDEQSVSVSTAVRAPSLAVRVEPTISTGGRVPVAGDVVGLSVQVRNTGNVTLSSVAATVRDEGELVVTCPNDVLAPGATVDCTVTSHTLSQSDVDAGSVGFAVRASAQGPSGDAVDAVDSASMTIDAADRITVTASASASSDDESEGLPHAGSRVERSAIVRNVGNTTVRDAVLEVVGTDGAVCPGGALAPGAEVACTIPDHLLTQQEIDHGSVAFDVTAQVGAPKGRDARAEDRTELTLPQSARISSTATSVLDPNEHEVPLAGDTARVQVRVRNTGNVSVTGLRSAIEGRTEMTTECSVDALLPGESVTCTATGYALTQDDLDAGTVRFVVVSAATGADRQRAETRAEHDLVLVRAPAVATTSSIDLEGTADGPPHAGDRADVAVSLWNRGNVTLSALSATATPAGGSVAMPVTCPAGVVAPGGHASCRLDGYALTQSDVDSGKLVFDVTGTARGTGGRVVSDAGRAATVIDRDPALEVTLSAAHAPSEDPIPVAGDRIVLRSAVRNTGNVTLDGVHGTLLELPDAEVRCPAGPIAPGETVDCSIPEHTVTQSELEDGVVSFVVVVDAGAPDDAVATDRDEVAVGLVAKSGLDLAAELVREDGAGDVVAVDPHHALRPGERIAVRYAVRNTGNLTVDDLQGVPGLVAVVAESTHLASGARTTAMSATHVVTERDAAAGSVAIDAQLRGTVIRADGPAEGATDGATTGQTGPVSDLHGVRASSVDRIPHRVVTDEPVWVYSERVRISATVAPLVQEPELAFTGSGVLTVLPIAGALLIGGVLLAALRRRHGNESGRHRR